VDLWNMQEFRASLGFGAVAGAALLFAGLAISARGRRRPLQLGGVVIAGGGLWAIADNRHLPFPVVLGVIGIGAVGGLTHAHRLSRWYCVALAFPFAWAIGFRGELASALWARVFVTVAVCAGAILLAEFDDAWRREAPGLTLFAVTSLGVYATVPDTELVAAVLGASLPLVLLGWPARLATLGRAGGPAAIALLVWTGAAGGEGRPASIIAVVACLGLLVGSPLAQLLLPRAGDRLRRVPSSASVLSLMTGHAVIVLLASRVGGQLSDPVAAASFGTLIGMAAVLVGALFRPPSRAAAPIRVD
jgi:hypothetical protein